MMHVARFGIGLAEAAARRGARIFEEAGVTALARLPNGGFRLTTPRGTLEAGQVIVATGGSTRGPFGYFRRRFVPFGSLFSSRWQRNVKSLHEEIALSAHTRKEK